MKKGLHLIKNFEYVYYNELQLVSRFLLCFYVNKISFTTNPYKHNLWDANLLLNDFDFDLFLDIIEKKKKHKITTKNQKHKNINFWYTQ